MDNNNNSRIYQSGNIGSSLKNRDFKSKLKNVLRKYIDFHKGREQFIWIQDCILNYILDGTDTNESDVHSLMDHTGLAEGLYKEAYDHVFETIIHLKNVRNGKEFVQVKQNLAIIKSQKAVKKNKGTLKG